MSAAKRTIDSFFKPPAKKPRVSESTTLEERRVGDEPNEREFTRHSTYPFPIPYFPSSIASELSSFPSSIGKEINDQADLNLLYFEPYIPKYLERQVFQFLRSEFPFYRVEYDINRGGISTHIITPRWTSVFGIDETSRFNDIGEVIDANSGKKVEKERYYTKYRPRPIPKCLDDLRLSTEAATGCKFNFCLVNYYASGSDSISYHSDDERFLGPLPAIASFSLGARRDFLMKHKPIPQMIMPPTTSNKTHQAATCKRRHGIDARKNASKLAPFYSQTNGKECR